MLRIECAAVLFDLDGVLVDSTAYVERQWREWAAWRGLDPAPFLRVCHGRRALETIRLAAPELDAEAEVARFREKLIEDDPVLAPVPGAAELLAAVPAGVWAVVTSGNRVTATRRLTSAGLPIPSVLVTAEDVGQGKPSPEGYLRAAERLGVSPAECVVIEDAPPGIEAGLAAGMRVVGLTSTYPPEALAAAHHRIAALSELRLVLPSAASPPK
jgi:sugar-phosphatase